jgi:uncharacterized protein YbjT (DUF2867 family)
MATNKRRTIVVTGATGLQGNAVTRYLLLERWHVRALTRKASSQKAQALSALGADIVQGDMNDPASLTRVFEGAYGVFSVQNPVLSGVEGEIRQGKNVADVAKQVGIEHLVYSSAGTGNQATGIPSWESKLVIETHMKELDLPLTILRPMAFMELMIEKKFFPAISTWHIMPKLMGSMRKIAWLCADDFGIIVAKVFAEPDRFISQDLKLASDVQSIDECRTIYRDVIGKNPPRFPMPVWLFERFGFVGKDLSIMWQWLQSAVIDLDTRPTLSIHPQALTIHSWLSNR